MARALRATTAAVLAFAITALPVIPDRCTASCEANHAVASTPACHHTTSGSHVAHIPLACGRDHHAIQINAPSIADAIGRPLGKTLASVPAPHSPMTADASRDSWFGSSPPIHPAALNTLSPPLRI